MYLPSKIYHNLETTWHKKAYASLFILSCMKKFNWNIYWTVRSAVDVCILYVYYVKYSRHPLFYIFNYLCFYRYPHMYMDLQQIVEDKLEVWRLNQSVERRAPWKRLPLRILTKLIKFLKLIIFFWPELRIYSLIVIGFSWSRVYDLTMHWIKPGSDEINSMKIIIAE